MKFELEVTSENGVHARPAGSLALIAKKYPDLDINLTSNNGNVASAQSPLQIMQLGLQQGDKVYVEISLRDENKNNEDCEIVKEEIIEILGKSYQNSPSFQM
ncbi:MAG: HPr family phosphocarrier protein [Candidatus Improbicoccus devescovinae]|nr:MAG: HPr family phosphocarrier protein [Candidatus Improbicoccus devescovinae]